MAEIAGKRLNSFSVSDLVEGLVFSESVYVSHGGRFVPVNPLITAGDLEKFLSLGIHTVYTAGELRAPAAGGEPEARLSPSQAFSINSAPKPGSAYSFASIPKNMAAYRVYKSLIERTNEVFLRISEGSPLESKSVNAMTTELLDALRNRREQFIGFVLGGDVKGYDMAKSAVNIAILSALTAQEIRLPAHRVFYVIIGAFLHDSGMFQLPKKILEKRGELTPAERKQIQNHPVLSRQIAVRGLSYPAEVGEIVLQHHERWDGKGYPYGTGGGSISVGARIVSIADSFEAMVSHKPYRSSIVGYEANKSLLADNSRRFDPDILKTFILTMGVYPIGSIVRLNNGTVARIAEVRADTPLRPKVQVLVEQGQQVSSGPEGVFIDLLSEKALFIVKALSAKDVHVNG